VRRQGSTIDRDGVQERDPAADRARAGVLAERPGKLRLRSWFGAFGRTLRGFSRDHLTDWAAALTYYGVQALFPALIFLVSIIGLIGPSATQPLLDNLGKLAPGPANSILGAAVKQIASSRGAAGIAFIAGLAGALWSASGYVGAFARASNAIYEVGEGRPFWKLRPIQIAVTVAMTLLLAIGAVAVVVTGPIAKQVGSLVGLGGAAVTAWDIAKWPALIVIVITMFSVLYWAAPNIKQPSFRWITPGGVLAVGLWILASAGFAFYVANFGSYNKTYGSMAAVVVFLVWLWISNLALLLGAEFNAEVERGRELQAGLPADEEILLEPRNEPKRR